MAKPKLIVFDLDYTLWPFWVDTHVDPPFKLKKDGKVYDCRGHSVSPYPEVPSVLQRLKNEGYEIGIASRTSELQGARSLLELFGFNKYILYKEIYPGCKITHFRKLKKNSGFEFSEMLFFDDEQRNKYDMDKIGVLMYLVDDRIGITHDVIDKGLKMFAERAASGH